MAVVENLFGRRIVGSLMDQAMTRRLVAEALEMAPVGRRPGSELVAHSDRGSQYAGERDRRRS